MNVGLKINNPRYKFSFVAIVIMVGVSLYLLFDTYKQVESLENNLNSTKEQLSQTQSELFQIKGQDQVKINQELKEEVENINTTYKNAVSVYEELLDYKETVEDTSDLDELYAKSLSLLAEKNYEEAQNTIDEINIIIREEKEKTAQEEKAKAAAAQPPAPQSNQPPGSGYSRQTVSSEAGNFLVDIVSADIGSTRVIVDTASGGDCGNDCPVLPLSDYISRNGAFAGVNGSYFCPASHEKPDHLQAQRGGLVGSRDGD